jgi:hypothetical protein
MTEDERNWGTEKYICKPWLGANTTTKRVLPLFHESVKCKMRTWQTVHADEVLVLVLQYYSNTISVQRRIHVVAYYYH